MKKVLYGLFAIIMLPFLMSFDDEYKAKKTADELVCTTHVELEQRLKKEYPDARDFSFQYDFVPANNFDQNMFNALYSLDNTCFACCDNYGDCFL